MTALTVINLFLLPCLVTILIGGAIMNYKYIEKNIYQTYLISTLLFWAAVMTFVYVKFFSDGGSTISYTRDVCSVQVILIGIPSFFSLICYPVVILDAGFLSVKKWLANLSPLLIVVAIYFVYHYAAGLDPFVRYDSVGELLNDVGSTSIILRLLMVVAFVLVAVAAMVRIWMVVPMYNKYVCDNIADSDYNVDWIQKLILYTGFVTLTYLLVLFYSSIYVNCIYIISLILLFTYIIIMSIFHRTSEGVTILALRRGENHIKKYTSINKNGSDGEDQTVVSNNARVVTLEMINDWMRTDAPYTRADFTTNDIIDAFPLLIHHELTDIFRSHGETFQSYVKHFRIVKACEIIGSGNSRLYPKETFAMVGFSHHSSFSRSFVSLVGMPPSDYLRLSDEERAIALAKVSKYH